MRGDTKDKIEKQNIKKTDILKKEIIKLKNQDKEINLIEDKKLKNLIFEITDWGRIDKYKNEIFTLIEDYLGYANNAKEAEWKCYLENAASMNWKINIADFALNRAFSNAKQNNKLDNLSELAHTHLLSCYKQYYSDLIPQIDAKDDQLEAIIQISSLIQKLNNKSNVDTDIYKRFEIYPRSIGNLDEKDLFKTPIRGVGSPHGMCITIYHKQGQKMPVMLQAAGTTGDPVLNRRHYISLFSAALTSNKDPRFVLPYSSCFAIGDNIPQTESENMLQAVIGPNGLEEPKKGVPTINMNPDEAMIMLGDLMSKAQADTGLVQIIHMDIDNALIFEQKIIQALEANQESVLSCMDNESASTGVIHHLPYYILKNNKAIPIEINIPFSVLNHERIFLLLKATRNA
jgi:hypothetical protein